jgi:hypothetical protein
MVAPEFMLAQTDLPEDFHVAWSFSLSIYYFLSNQRKGFEAVIKVCGQGVCVWILTIMADI